MDSFVRSAVGAAAMSRAVHLIELGEDQVRSLVCDVAGDGVLPSQRRWPLRNLHRQW